MPKPKKFPPLPKVVRCPGGDVPVRRVTTQEIQRFAGKDEQLLGYLHEIDRYIEVRSEMPMEAQWRTYFHEWGHVLLSDSGIANGLNLPLEEAICDAIASARMVERWG